MTSTREELPSSDEGGTAGTWIFTDRNDDVWKIEGTFLGVGSSYRPTHKGHEGTPYVPRGGHCSTCRWMEIRIFRTDTRYFVVYTGKSIAPGEVSVITVEEAVNGMQVYERLLITKNGRTSLTFPSRMALTAAMEWDDDIYDTYVRRAG